MKLSIFQINAFTSSSFGGNPACVVPLESWLSDQTMLYIARENGVAETAFFIDKGDYIHLRWFTPDIEIDLCGHATLATSHCLFHHLNYHKDVIQYKSKSGKLSVHKTQGLYCLDFPTREGVASTLPRKISEALSIAPKEIYKARDYMLVYDKQEDVETLLVHREIFDQINLNPGGVIVTAPGKTHDFVSRFFTPQATILEDPVTGSAHCTLIPYWSKRLKKKVMNAQQLSERTGDIGCEIKGRRVLISGAATTYFEGSFYIDKD